MTSDHRPFDPEILIRGGAQLDMLMDGRWPILHCPPLGIVHAIPAFLCHAKQKAIRWQPAGHHR